MKLKELELLVEMANLRDDVHGITGVVLNLYPDIDRLQHSGRVKVSNVPNTFSENDNFTITTPRLDIIGNVKISKDNLTKVLEWIKMNADIIDAFEKRKLGDRELRRQSRRIQYK